MSLEGRLFQAVLEDPENVDLRLVFADWYQDHGDPRAEFIQVQVALDRLPKGHVWREDMEKRERDLLAEYRKEWDAPLYRQLNQTGLKGEVRARRGIVRGWEYRRGFVEHLTVDASTLMFWFPTFQQLGPLRSIRIGNAQRVLSQLVNWEPLSQFVKVDLRHNPIGDAGFSEFWESPYLSQVSEFNLVDVGLTDESLDLLLAADRFPNLKRLVLSQNRFSRDGWGQLLFHFGLRLEHENGSQPLTTYLKQYETEEPEFESYDDDLLYDGGHIDTEGKRQVDGEWVEDYDEYEGFEAFDEEDLRDLGGYENRGHWDEEED